MAELTAGSENVEVAVIPPHPFLVPVGEQVNFQSETSFPLFLSGLFVFFIQVLTP